jgi:hypothetical protein
VIGKSGQTDRTLRGIVTIGASATATAPTPQLDAHTAEKQQSDELAAQQRPSAQGPSRKVACFWLVADWWTAAISWHDEVGLALADPTPSARAMPTNSMVTTARIWNSDRIMASTNATARGGFLDLDQTESPNELS